MPDGKIIVYGTEWCGDCRRVRRFLIEHNIDHQYVDIDRDRKAEQFVMKTNRGYRSVPTILFPDGSTLTEPSNARLADKLGITLPGPIPTSR